jgi:hypothetical protein
MAGVRLANFSNFWSMLRISYIEYTVLSVTLKALKKYCIPNFEKNSDISENNSFLLTTHVEKNSKGYF